MENNSTKRLTRKNKLVLLALGSSTIVFTFVIILATYAVIKGHLDKTNSSTNPSVVNTSSGSVVPVAVPDLGLNQQNPQLLKITHEYITANNKIYDYDQTSIKDITASTGLPSTFNYFSNFSFYQFQILTKTSLLSLTDSTGKNNTIYYYNLQTLKAEKLVTLTNNLGVSEYNRGSYDPDNQLLYLLDSQNGKVYKYNLHTQKTTLFADLGYKFAGGRGARLTDDGIIELSPDKKYLLTVETDHHTDNSNKALPNITIVGINGSVYSRLDGTFPRWLNSTTLIYLNNSSGSKDNYPNDNKIYTYDLITKTSKAITKTLTTTTDDIAAIRVQDNNTVIINKFGDNIVGEKLDLTTNTLTTIASNGYLIETNPLQNLGLKVRNCDANGPTARTLYIQCPIDASTLEYAVGFVSISNNHQADLLAFDPINL